ncbi:hypothetical protein EON63_00455, partial [archaeon]
MHIHIQTQVMTITNPCKIIIEDLPEDPLCVYAPMFDTHTNGIFTLHLPSHIHIDSVYVQNQTLPMYIQLRHAVWLCVYKCDEHCDGDGYGGVYYSRAILDHSVEQDLQYTIPWCPATIPPQPLMHLPHTHTMHTKEEWIELCSSPSHTHTNTQMN